MIRYCRRATCNQPFTVTRKHNRYCSDPCREEARRRICQLCGESFLVTNDVQERTYCSDRCRLNASRQAALDAAAAARRARGRIEVQCALVKRGLCPQPHDLISTVRSHPVRYHPECNRVRYTLPRKHTAPPRRWGEGRVEVRCTACGDARRYFKSKIPRTANSETLTWICPNCRTRATEYRRFTCTLPSCGVGFLRRVDVGSPDIERFCTRDHRRRYYIDLRRQANPCRYCGAVIQRGRRRVSYCDWECYVAAKQGRPLRHYRPSKAELRILGAWSAGVRGVRPLAAASETSTHTVQKLIKAGKIAS